MKAVYCVGILDFTFDDYETEYENSLKIYRDLKGVIDTAFDEEKMEGKIETAKALKKLGVSIETIIRATGLTKEEIEKLYQELM